MVPMIGIDTEVRMLSIKAKETRGIAAMSGRNALYRHLRSVQSSSKPMKPPNRTQTAKVNGADTPLEALVWSLKYIRKR